MNDTFGFTRCTAGKQNIQRVIKWQLRKSQFPVYEELAAMPLPLLGGWHRRDLCDGRVTLSLFTVAGNRIRSFEDRGADIGYNYGTSWDGTDGDGRTVAAGVYVLETIALGERSMSKMALIK